MNNRESSFFHSCTNNNNIRAFILFYNSFLMRKFSLGSLAKYYVLINVITFVSIGINNNKWLE